ncbi:hypothetical protein M9H77_17468 [Catharanthus roseus]|uniref:Uncharacterized protein n=1 Tax=Catharanthus roseus TaxID=4058 RepID=A0ACC0B4P0_CATRO|nr:hypothetical protein M9H77_17468 [Catharanthus roseus]
MGGRLILIKYVLNSIPLHILSTISPPKQTLHEIERLYAKFFWGQFDRMIRGIRCFGLDFVVLWRKMVLASLPFIISQQPFPINFGGFIVLVILFGPGLYVQSMGILLIFGLMGSLSIWLLTIGVVCLVFGKKLSRILVLSFEMGALPSGGKIGHRGGWHSTEAQFHGKFVPILWKLPFNDQDIILNVDGASKGNPGLAAAGGVLRRCDGTLIYAFSNSVIIILTLIQKPFLLISVAMAIDMGYYSCSLQSDSIAMVSMINGSFSIPWRLDEILKHIYHLLSFHQFSIAHAYQEANTMPDALANLAWEARASAAARSINGTLVMTPLNLLRAILVDYPCYFLGRKRKYYSSVGSMKLYLGNGKWFNSFVVVVLTYLVTRQDDVKAYYAALLQRQREQEESVKEQNRIPIL